MDEVGSHAAPIVTVIAAAGAGKTVLLQQLAQAEAEKRASPVALVSCAHDDRDSRRFIAKIHRSVAASLRRTAPNCGADHGPGVPPASAGSLATSLVEQFGGELHLLFDDVHRLFDDVHRLGAAGEGFDVLNALVTAAPEIGRITLAGRRRIPNLARLRAGGLVNDLDSGLLCFTPAERRAVTGDDDDRYDGWPALVSLHAAAGRDAIEEYLTEQVIEPLSIPSRHLLAAAAILGGAGRGLLGEALGCSVPAEAFEVLTALPLVSVSSVEVDAELLVHPIYGELDSTNPTPDVRSRVAAIGANQFMISDPDRSARLLLDSINGNDLSGAVDVWSRLGYSDVPRELLAGLTGAASSMASSRTNPELALLRGLLRRTADPMATEAVELLGIAASGFADQGRWADVIIARTEQGFAHRIRGHREATVAALREAVKLADRLDGSTQRNVQARVIMANAVLADEAGDDAEVLRNVELLEEELLPHRYGCSAHFLAMFCSLQMGDGVGAVRAAEHFVQTAPDDRLWAGHLPSVASWHSGRPFPVGQTLPGPDHYQTGNAVDRTWAGSSIGLLAALRGDLVTAAEALAAARESCPVETLARMRSLISSTEATVAVADGREEDACRVIQQGVALLREANGLQPDQGRGLVRHFHWCLAIAYVVAPELRQLLDAVPLAPSLAAKRRAGRAMVALGNGDRIDIDDESHDELRALAAALPVRWAARLAAALHGQRSSAAEPFTAAVVELYGAAVRASWRSSGDGTSLKLAKTVAVDPGHRVEINLLGPLQVVIDGVERTGGHWTRDRVRALLALLAHHGSMRREEVMLALWPDLDDESGRGNLRVTLSHLRSVLEPRRTSGEAPFFVRAEDDRIRLLVHGSVSTDVAQFDRMLDEAGHLETEGDQTQAVECYQRAVGLWRGDYLCQYACEDWPQITATRLQARFVDACLKSGRYLVDSDRFQEAIGMAELALGAEQWSESAYGLVIEAQLLGGNRAGAARTMSTYRTIIDDLGVDPGSSMKDLAVRLDVWSTASANSG